MRHSYALVLYDAAGERSYEAATCESASELIGLARAALQRDPRLARVEVFFGPDRLFSLTAGDEEPPAMEA